jgi:hypothetical protein
VSVMLPSITPWFGENEHAMIAPQATAPTRKASLTAKF